MCRFVAFFVLLYSGRLSPPAHTSYVFIVAWGGILSAGAVAIVLFTLGVEKLGASKHGGQICILCLQGGGRASGGRRITTG